MDTAVTVVDGSDNCVKANSFSSIYGKNMGEKPGKVDLQFCTWYKDKTCCSKDYSASLRNADIDYESNTPPVINGYAPPGSAEGTGQNSKDCADLLNLHFCAFCDPDYGTRWGQKHKSDSGAVYLSEEGTTTYYRTRDNCKAYYEALWDKCKDDSYIKYEYPNLDETGAAYVEDEANTIFCEPMYCVLCRQGKMVKSCPVLFDKAENMYYAMYDGINCLQGSYWSDTTSARWTTKEKSQSTWDTLPTSDCWSAGDETAPVIVLFFGALVCLALC